MSRAYEDPGGGKQCETPSKRLFSELSPGYATPQDRCKRTQLSESCEKNTENICDISSNSNVDYCELVSQATTYLAKINELINDQGSRINIANKTAVMDLTQRITGIVSCLAIKSLSNETKLSNTERQLENLKHRETVLAGNNTNSSYSDKLRLPKSSTANVQTRTAAPCIVAYPTTERSADYTSSSATKQALMKVIKPSDDGFQIVGVKKAAKSGVVLRVANESQLRKLEAVEAIKSVGLRFEKPKGRRPRILVKDVPGKLEDSAFLMCLYRQNIKDELKLSESEFVKSTKIIRKRNLDNGRKWVGIEVDSAVRKHLATTKDKLFIDWATCRFIDDVEVVRCLKCQQFGHVYKFCTSKTSFCALCAGEHDTRVCPNKDKPEFVPTCITCKYLKKPHDHRCGIQECGAYKLKIEQLILNTNY